MQIIKNRIKTLGLADSTNRTYTSILNRFFDHTHKVKGFSLSEINDYLDYLMLVKNYTARSRNLVSKVIRFYCREFDGKDFTIRKAKENRPIPKICDDQDFIQVLSATPNIKHRLCLLLMRYSGLRRWEVIRVMKHHIQPDGRLLVKDGKGRKDRYTIIPPQVLEPLQAYISILPVDNPYVFQGQSNKHYSSMTPQRILINAFVKLRWKKEKWFGCHALRHAFAVWCLDEAEIELETLRTMMGHSSLRTTSIYLQHRKLNYQKAIERCKEVSIIH